MELLPTGLTLAVFHCMRTTKPWLYSSMGKPYQCLDPRHDTQLTEARLRSRVRKPRKPSESTIPKAVLAKEIARILDDREITQTEASYIIRDAPSQISLMVNGKTRGFSFERLTRTLVLLGRDMDIIIRKTKGNAGKVRLSMK